MFDVIRSMDMELAGEDFRVTYKDLKVGDLRALEEVDIEDPASSARSTMRVIDASLVKLVHIASGEEFPVDAIPVNVAKEALENILTNFPRSGSRRT